ncbi:uncharacterized protein NEMAJ01_0442 [Nematocida major]|uniref:uncharacterized protein n=1 Tax=Nematocida major TaxID=1912982 RepID=UPI00200747E5|nr:uncharacterized protein NEMAJ01_0442 [Nematocida major]KAH9385546.1 hypothetical protein NEMAJ01_0442 [Nematocida major]
MHVQKHGDKQKKASMGEKSRAFEHACTLLSIGRMSLDVFQIFSEAVSAYNCVLKQSGCALQICLAKNELVYSKVHRGLLKMYTEEAKRPACRERAVHTSGLSGVCSMLARWSRASSVEAHRPKRGETQRQHSPESLALRSLATREISAYIRANLTETFDKAFVQASQRGEREASDALCLQCKLVTDRRVGEYLCEESVLGWSEERVREAVVLRLDRIHQEYVALEAQAEPSGQPLRSLDEEKACASIREGLKALMHEIRPLLKGWSMQEDTHAHVSEAVHYILKAANAMRVE